ncbi:putative zinc ribbon protein [Enterobacter roggenkampii]|uniref:putative zinc ribbon protein n=1 Tax=Enterobacter roggenkampii TaxID=1812935 RepID=UPI003D6E9862
MIESINVNKRTLSSSIVSNRNRRQWLDAYHHAAKLSENGRQHCPYVKPGVRETRHIRQLQSYVPEARPLVFYADWHCHGCGSDYHGERYCLTCRTGEHSDVRADTNRIEEVTACAC